MNIEAKNDVTNNVTVFMDGNAGNVVASGNGQIGGSLILKDKSGTERILLLGDPEGVTFSANIVLRGDQSSIALHGSGIVLNGTLGNITVGGPPGVGGDVALYPANSSAADLNDFAKASIQLNGNSGSVVLRKNKQDSIVLNPQLGNIGVGGPAGAAGNIFLYPENSSTPNIELNGQSGDIILLNAADCAEDFDIVTSEDVDPGMVMVIDQENQLRPSMEPYDKKVAGVVSGAGGFRPGIVLDRKQPKNNRLPVALMGKVYCWVDAAYSPIEVGDMLTTSSTLGHAMKANDPQRSFGAVIGKALRALESGQELIPILVALQ
jgi:hypothetical protein